MLAASLKVAVQKRFTAETRSMPGKAISSKISKLCASESLWRNQTG